MGALHIPFKALIPFPSSLTAARNTMAASAKILDSAVYRRFMARPQVCGVDATRCLAVRVMLKFKFLWVANCEWASCVTACCAALCLPGPFDPS